MHTAVLELFNDILEPGAPIPENWKHSKLTVIFKKGERTDLKNHRLISIIPVLAKLFSIASTFESGE